MGKPSLLFCTPEPDRQRIFCAAPFPLENLSRSCIGPADISNRYPRSATPVVYPQSRLARRISFLVSSNGRLRRLITFVASLKKSALETRYSIRLKSRRHTLEKYFSRGLLFLNRTADVIHAPSGGSENPVSAFVLFRTCVLRLRARDATILQIYI